MKICEVSTGSMAASPTATGAVEQIIYHLSTKLAEIGHEVHVLDIEKRPWESDKIMVHKVFSPRLGARDREISIGTDVLRRLFYSQAAWMKLAQLLTKEKFDIIHLHNQFSGITCSILTRIIRALHCQESKIVYTVHNPEWLLQQSQTGFIVKYAQELISIKLCDLVVAVSAPLKERIKGVLKIPDSKLIVIPNGIDLSITEGLHEELDECTILCVARIARYKNQELLVRASRKVVDCFPNAKFILAGPVSDLRYYVRLKEILREQNLPQGCLVFTGEMSRREILIHLSKCTIFALPSLSEGVPLALLEAMAFAKPIVASDIPPLRGILRHGTGLLFNPYDPNDLVHALMTMLMDRDLQAMAGRKARLIVKERFGWDSVARKYAKLYKGLVEEKAIEGSYNY